MNKNILVLGIVSFLVLMGVALLLSLFITGSDFSIGKKIAIIPVKGPIASEQDSLSQYFSAGEIVEHLQDAAEDTSIAAIFLDIDSPGGSVVETRQIAYAVREIKKPVVAWIGDLGASGAYYVAAASDYVLADPDSITGSVGVISMFMNLSNLLQDFGVDVNVLTAGENKGIGSPFKAFTEEDKKLIDELLQQAFEKFKSDVKEFRGEKLNTLKFNEVADGRILSGLQAKNIGMIDEISTRKKAIDKAAELAGIKGKPQFKKYKKKDIGLLDLLSSSGYSFGSGFKQAMVENEVSISS